MRQLTDDDIQDFTTRLVEYLDNTPALFDKGVITDEGWDHLSEFVYQRLENFSSGYVNYN